MNNHSKWLLGLLLLVFGALQASAATAPSAGQPRIYTKEAPLVYEDTWDLWPYSFLNEKGEPDGYNVDLVRLILKELNIPYIIKMKPRQEALVDLRDGRSDLMLGLAAGFHNEYGKYSQNAVTLFTQSVVGPKNKPIGVQTFKDLSQQQVTVYEGSLCHHLMVDYGWGANAIPSNDIKESIQEISSTGTGQIVWNTLSLKWLLRKYQIDDLQITPVDMPHGEYKFMSNDTRLLNQLDSVYTELSSAEKLRNIQNKWFYPERHEKGIPAWVWYVVGAILLFILTTIFYIINYQIQGRRMTEQIAQRNKRLALVLETCQVRMWTYDIATQVFTWRNENGQPAYTYTSEEFANRYHPGDFKRLLEGLNQIANMEREELTLNIKAKDTEDGDAQERDFFVSLSVLHRENGKPTVIIGTKRDITEERQQQRQAENRKLQYWALFNTPMLDVTFYDKDGILVNINPKACETFCCNREEIIAEHVSYCDILRLPVLSAEELDGFHSTRIIDLDHIPTEQHGRKVKAIKRTGTIYYEAMLMPVFDDKHNLMGIFAIGRDNTQAVGSIGEQQASIEQIQAATKELTEYISNINYVLKSAGVRMANYSPDRHTLTIYSKTNEVQHAFTQARCMTLVDDKSKKKAMRMLNNMGNRTTNSIDTDISTVIRVASGNFLHLQFHFIPNYDDAGNVTDYFGMCRDVTEIMATEQQLAQETAKAQEVENTKNSFLKNVSYEIRTPLSAVVGFAELFEAEHASDDEEVFIQQILENSDQLLHLINSILFLSRLDAHMIEINKRPWNFAGSFESYCNTGWSPYKKEGVNYIVENPYQELEVDIDATNLGRVIEQITANAAQNTQRGTIRARYDYIGRRLMISIEDTGNGIPQADINHIFERFVSDSNSGSGLGLPISKELTEQMGGTLEINSEAGLGTTVWITIPCHASVIKRKKII
ncbi:MAG: transporter substrate-binding domain-containing protein [Prevotella sp.]|nr:transporter substrate-binding domain-containing protein [Prevotella sp.]